MPRSYDLTPVKVTNNPAQRLDTAIGKLPPFDFSQIVDGFLTALKDFTGIDLTGIRDFLEGLFGSIDWSAIDVGAALAQLVSKINDAAGINLSSWPAFLASLDDGAGIDLPVVPQIVAALSGIDFSQPGAVLDAITAAGGTITSRLRGLIDISWLTDEHQNLILESGYDAPITVGAEDDPAITQDPTDGIPGTTPLGCLRIELDGQNHERIGELIPVGKGWELAVASAVKRESVTGAAGSVRVELQPYSLSGEVATPVGARVVVASHAAPAGSSTGWESISGSWTVPSDGSVTHVAVIPGATSAATAGVVKFDNTTMVATQAIPQNFIKDLLADLESLMNWIGTVVDTLLTRLGLPPTGSLLDRIHDLGDEIQLMQERGEDALAGLADKLGLTDWNAHLAQLLSNPGALLGQLGMGKVDGLLNWQSVQNQINALLAQDPDLMIVPINSTVQDVKDFIIGNRNKTARLTGDGKLDKTDVLGLQIALDGAGQDVRDAICNALGVTGTGHTAADVLAALTSIPASVVQSGIEGATTIDNAIQNAIDAVIHGAGGLGGSGFSITDMIGQLVGLRSGVQGNAEQLAMLQVSMAGLDPAASSEVVNFSEFVDSSAPPSMFTKINDINSGSVITSGGTLAWSGGAGREFYLFNGGPLQTDLAEVKLVLPTVPSHGWFGDDSTNYVYLILRANSTGTNMVMARFGWDEVRIYSYNAGTFTQLGAGYTKSDLITGGCSVSFKGGTAADPRYFRIQVNEKTLYDVVDSGPVSLYGSSYRYCGFGIEKGSSYNTAAISSWSMLDGGASAGSGVVAGFVNTTTTNLELRIMTAAQYAALPTKKPTAAYLIQG